jgi:hypothetical protein
VSAEEYRFWSRIIGISAGTLSIISLIQKLAHVGLSSLPKLIIFYYEDLLTPIHVVVGYFSPFHVPEWYQDCFVISALCSTAVGRTIHRLGADLDEHAPNAPSAAELDELRKANEKNVAGLLLRKLVLFIIFTPLIITLIPIAIVVSVIILMSLSLLLSAITHVLYSMNLIDYPEPVILDDFAVSILWTLMIIGMAAIAFFVWNAAVR